MLCLFLSLLVFFSLVCGVTLNCVFMLRFFALLFLLLFPCIVFTPMRHNATGKRIFFFVCRMQPGLRHVCRCSVTRNHDLHDDDLLFFFTSITHNTRTTTKKWQLPASAHSYVRIAVKERRRHSLWECAG